MIEYRDFLSIPNAEIAFKMTQEYYNSIENESNVLPSLLHTLAEMIDSAIRKGVGYIAYTYKRGLTPTQEYELENYFKDKGYCIKMLSDPEGSLTISINWYK